MRKIKWTKEVVLKNALQYNTIKEWRLNSHKGYLAAVRLKIIKECSTHMIVKYFKRTNEDLMIDAKKYNSRYEWFQKSPDFYSAAQRRKLLDICCAHMKLKYKSKGFWTNKKLKEDALKYTTKTNWSKNSSTAYNCARFKGEKFFNDCCKHMLLKGNFFKKIVYVYEFADNHVYVGLTCQEDVRKNCHLGKYKAKSLQSPVYRHIKLTNLFPVYKNITGKYIDAKQAQQLEKNEIKRYKNENWILLNKHKGGALGGTKFWTPEKIIKIAQEYTTVKMWRENSSGSYSAALKYKIKDECCKHMKWTKRKPWTDEEIIQDALKYTSRGEWQKKSTSPYLLALRKGLMEICCKHMISLRRMKWNQEDLIIDAKQYKSKSEWKNNSSGYTAARKMKILFICCEHMKKG